MMKDLYCEREALVASALNAGAFDGDDSLVTHAAGCPVCSEVVLITRFLKTETPDVAPQLPDAGILWWRAQLDVKRNAVARATRAVRIVRSLAYITAAGAMAWILFEAMQPGPFNSSVAPYTAPFTRLMSTMSGELALFGGVLAFLTVLLGSMYILWAEN